MNFDDQLQRYFGTRDIDALPAAAMTGAGSIAAFCALVAAVSAGTGA